MSDADWNEGGWMRTIGMFLPGDAPEIRDRTGKPVQDDDFLLLVNSHSEKVEFRIPEDLDPARWNVEVDSSRGGFVQNKPPLCPGAEGKIALADRSLVLLRRERTGVG
jgi:glycogen operon protein